MPFTSGFSSAIELADHFRKHGNEFVGVASAIEYQRRADEFLGGPKRSTTLEYRRTKGDLVRFDPTTDEFGVLMVSGYIRTYFKPKPGVTHGRRTNLDYFNQTCRLY